MICKQCKAEGKKSFVYSGGTFSTAMPNQAYYDEEGNYHFHDMNAHTTNYSCSNSHEWEVTAENKCPSSNCDWRR